MISKSVHTLIAFAELTTGIFFFLYISIGLGSSNHIYSSTEEFETFEVALVLGTSRTTAGGKYQNQFFNNRINAAVELYEKSKVNCILISGDNSEKYYNEPQDMKSALIEKGIPADIIYLDFAGFSTYESVYRAQAIFQLESCLIVSQKFHVERAVWLARSLGIDAHGYIAEPVNPPTAIKTQIREIPARALAFWDWLTHPRPRFLGDQIDMQCNSK